MKKIFNKKIFQSFFLWLLSIGLFDLILIFLQKEQRSISNAELVFMILVIVFGIASFIAFITNLEKIFRQKFHRIKAKIFSSLSFMFFLALGVVIIVVPIFLSVRNINQHIVKTTEASKNTLISSGLKLGSKGIQVQILQSALSNDKSLYPSGLVTGYYGDLTKQAVINFQKKYNLLATGEVDKQTADKFNEAYGDNTSDYYLSNYSNVNTGSNTNQDYYDVDPLINCNIHAYCGGGIRLLRKSVCDQSTCCQIGNSWIFYESKTKCIQDQQMQNNSVGCLIGNQWYYNLPSHDECIKAQNSYNSRFGSNNYQKPILAPFSTLGPFPTLIPLPTWNIPTNVPFPTYSPLPTRDPYCDTVKGRWKNFKIEFSKQKDNFTSSAEFMLALTSYMQKFQNEADNHGCNIKLYLY